MKENAPIFYILSQIGVFCIAYTLLLATHFASIAVDFCEPDFAGQTLFNLTKVAIFVMLIHAPGVVIAHRFADLKWRWAVLPLAFALAFVVILYGNDVILRWMSELHCEAGPAAVQTRSVFRPEWSHWLLQGCTRLMAYAWGITSLLVLYKTSKVPTDIYDE